jgi:hypothetical protein
MFVTYLTEYLGNKILPFYIGSTSAERLASGYRGSVRSQKWGAAHRGKKHSEETKARMSAAHSARIAANQSVGV